MSKPIIYSKEKIIEVGYSLVKKKGIEYLSSRNIAKELGCSIKPIFATFESMDNLKNEVLNFILDKYLEYINSGFNSFDKFEILGIRMVKFASKEPLLFKALFLSEYTNKLRINDFLDRNNKYNKQVVEVISSALNVSIDDAWDLFNQSWLDAFALSVGCATGTFKFDEEEISKNLRRGFIGTYLAIEEERKSK